MKRLHGPHRLFPEMLCDRDHEAATHERATANARVIIAAACTRRARERAYGDHSHVGGILVIALPSRLDAAALVHTEPEFRALVAAHNGNVLAELSDVTFLASLALRMLLANLNLARQHGDDLRLCRLGPATTEIFRKSRLDTLFQIEATRADGLASYGLATGTKQ